MLDLVDEALRKVALSVKVDDRGVLQRPHLGVLVPRETITNEVQLL